MQKTYASFYLPSEETEVKYPDKELTDRNSLYMRCKCSKSRYVSTEESSYMQNIAENMDLQGVTATVQRYATCALSDILLNQPVKDQKMLDYLFNSYAPALNLTLAQSEFNSLQEMYNAALAGQINVANFVQGFSDSMSAVTEQMRQENYTKYGEELPIDVVEKFNVNTKAGINRRKVDMIMEYVTQIQDIQLVLVGYIKNENAQFWRSGDYINKLIFIQDSQKAITLRIGSDFYEECVLEEMDAEITNIYSIKVTVNLLYNFYVGNYSLEKKDGRIMNPEPSVIGDFPTETKYAGIKYS